jgi:hypothetical protein
MMDTLDILIKGFFALLMSALIITIVLFVVGETVEHFSQ